MNKLHRQWRNWKFDKKIRLLVTSAILIISLTGLAVSMFFSVRSLIQQSISLNRARINTIAQNLSDSMENDKALMIALVMSEDIQKYGKTQEEKPPSESLTSQCNNLISNVLNMYSDLNFIAVLNSDRSGFLFRGRDTLVTTQVLQAFEEDYELSKALGDSTMRISYNRAYYSGTRYTLNLYFPIYDTSMPMVEHGLLCLNLSDTSLRQIQEEPEGEAEISIIDSQGMVLSSRVDEKNGMDAGHGEYLEGENGIFRRENTEYMYQKVQGWDIYVVAGLNVLKNYLSSFQIIAVMIILTGGFLFILLRMTRNVIAKAYRPLDDMISGMEKVSGGSLDVRLDEHVLGEDFAKVAVGFNYMMSQIRTLMVQVKQEQQEADQIRFNALQSQIQPHFLYNILECIHWQAIADGSQEISEMVKALARYYRICLSDGQDVIPLRLELEHVKNYLIIQNMRFDHVIDSEIVCEPDAEDILIPKMTLQPLVENSIHHGFKVKEGSRGTIRIAVAVEQDVVITVSDDGTGMSQEQINQINQSIREYDETIGYGVRNVNRRIGILFGENYGLHYESNPDRGVNVHIRIPAVKELSDVKS